MFLLLKKPTVAPSISVYGRTDGSTVGSYGVMVSTLDFESSDPSSNLGRTWQQLTPWRNGSASDSRSEGCVFESRRGHNGFCRQNADTDASL